MNISSQLPPRLSLSLSIYTTFFIITTKKKYIAASMTFQRKTLCMYCGRERKTVQASFKMIKAKTLQINGQQRCRWLGNNNNSFLF
mmetsp:Transcript_13832/g.21850  ORF Transcript_13832/g.21850 Transcript_13832/m.21850 type:complete len:86 (+) Transcript_13832:753-1010(+)